MKYVSLDIETTSLIPNPDHILMLSLVVEDTENPMPLEKLPSFTALIERNIYSGEPYALGMNGWIFQMLSGQKELPKNYRIGTLDNILGHLRDFLYEHFKNEKITVAGKNVAGFDMQFLPLGLRQRFDHRVIDPGSVLIDWSADRVLGLGTLKQRLDLSGPVAHDAYEDALDVIRVLRTTYNET